MTLQDIEKHTEKFARVRNVLVARVTAMEDALRAVRKLHIAGIRDSVGAAAAARAVLQEAIAESPEAFEKPKTRVLHGIKIGYRKQPGGITWDDDAQVLKLIRKHFPEQLDTLIRTTEKPVKDALANLPAADLKRLGVTVQDTGDVVFIKAVDSEVDKLVDALLADDEELGATA